VISGQSAAVVMTFAEQLGRLLFPVVPTDLSVSSRAVALQGPIPPVSAVFTGLGSYFLYHSVVMSRLLDVTELLARITTVLLSAAVLLVIVALGMVVGALWVKPGGYAFNQVPGVMIGVLSRLFQ